MLFDETFDFLPIIQSVGIILGLLFAGLGFFREGRARRASNYVTLVQNYREVWKLQLSNPEIARPLNIKPGDEIIVLSEEEKRFLSFLIFHLSTYHQLRKVRQIDKIEGISDDIQKFFLAPVVKQYWDDNKHFYNKDFVKFIDKEINVLPSR